MQLNASTRSSQLQLSANKCNKDWRRRVSGICLLPPANRLLGTNGHHSGQLVRPTNWRAISTEHDRWQPSPTVVQPPSSQGGRSGKLNNRQLFTRDVVGLTWPTDRPPLMGKLVLPARLWS